MLHHVCVRERERVCACVCVCEREREREREEEEEQEEEDEKRCGTSRTSQKGTKPFRLVSIHSALVPFLPRETFSMRICSEALLEQYSVSLLPRTFVGFPAGNDGDGPERPT